MVICSNIRSLKIEHLDLMPVRFQQKFEIGLDSSTRIATSSRRTASCRESSKATKSAWPEDESFVNPEFIDACTRPKHLDGVFYQFMGNGLLLLLVLQRNWN